MVRFMIQRNRIPIHLKFFERWAILSIVIGIISGLGAVLFYYLLDLCTAFFLGYIAGYHPPSAGGETDIFVFPQNSLIPWMIPLVLTIGGLISGIIVYKWAPEAEGHGTDAYISAFHYHRGIIKENVPIVKVAASVAVIGSGGSAGREGPIAQIGAGFGSWLIRLLKLSDKDRRIAIICGAAGGIGSVFKAPFGGAIFAIEVLYKRDLETDALIPAFISSTVAYSVFALFFGFNPIFDTPQYVFSDVSTLVFYAILGILCAPLAIVYVRVFYATRDQIFKRIEIPNHVKPAIGGFIVGLIAIFVPEVLGPGYGWIQLAIYGQLAISIMIIIIFAKIIATSLTIGSGGSGGVYAPSLVIGAMLGGVFAMLLKIVFPTIQIEPGAFVLVGMAAFFTGAAKVPIAAIIMVSEMTGDYNLLVPLMLACTLSYIFSRYWSIYESQVLTKATSPVHRGEFTVDILEKISVAKVMTKDVVIVTPETTIRKVSELISSTGHLGFPVVKNNELVGIVTYADIVKVPPERGEETLVKEVMTENVIVTTPRETLCNALQKMNTYGHGHLPVVDPENPRKLLGILTKKDIIKGHEIIRRIELLNQEGE